MYAIWVRQYKVEYNSNGGAEVDPAPVMVNAGSSITLPTGLTRTSYVFGGWNRNAAGTDTNYTGSYTPTNDIVLYARWNRTISYALNGGSGTLPPTQYSPDNTNITIGTGSPTRTGYVFGGWTIATNGTGTTYQAGNTYPVNGNATLNAKWNRTITFNLNGATGGTTPSNLYGPETTTIILPSTTDIWRFGYDIAGWNTQANGMGTNYNSGATYTVTAAAGNATLYARWQNTVTYNLNGGTSTVPASQTVIAGQSVTLAATPTRSGYRFDGWGLSSGSAGENFSAGSSYTPVGHTTIYARWTQNLNNTYSVSITGNSYVNGTLGYSISPSITQLQAYALGDRTIEWRRGSLTGTIVGTGTTYRLQEADRNQYIYVVISYANRAGNVYGVVRVENDITGVTNQAELMGMATNKKYILLNDITISGTWTPIAGEFTGALNGNGKTITFDNITTYSSYYSDSVYHLGLFAIVGAGAYITDLKLYTIGTKSITMTTTKVYMGTLAAHMKGGTIQNIAAYTWWDLKSAGEVFLGGIVGYQEGGTIKNCYHTGYSYAQSTTWNSFAGGFVGFQNGSNATIQHCFDLNSNVYVYSPSRLNTTYVGGIVGGTGPLGGKVQNCVAGNGQVGTTQSGSYSMQGRVSGIISNSNGVYSNNFGHSSMTMPINMGGTGGYKTAVSNINGTDGLNCTTANFESYTWWTSTGVNGPGFITMMDTSGNSIVPWVFRSGWGRPALWFE